MLKYHNSHIHRATPNFFIPFSKDDNGVYRYMRQKEGTAALMCVVALSRIK
jgi:hypothetical protein